MTTDADRAAQESRSARIHKRIDKLRQESDGTPDDDAPPAPEPENPREFVERRMRELEQGQQHEPPET